MSNCVTHHNACACREAHFARLEKELEAARQERDCALSDTSVKHKYRADVLEAQLEAARAEVQGRWTQGYEHGRKSTASRLTDLNGVTMTEYEAIERLQSQLQQARQRNSALLLRVKELEDASKARPPLPASRVKALERACRYILVDAVPCEESESPKQYCITAHAVEYVREALDAEASHAAACSLDAGDFTPVRDNCQFGNLGKQEQNVPARQGEER